MWAHTSRFATSDPLLPDAAWAACADTYEELWRAQWSEGALESEPWQPLLHRQLQWEESRLQFDQQQLTIDEGAQLLVATSTLPLPKPKRTSVVM